MQTRGVYVASMANERVGEAYSLGLFERLVGLLTRRLARILAKWSEALIARQVEAVRAQFQKEEAIRLVELIDRDRKKQEAERAALREDYEELMRSPYGARIAAFEEAVKNGTVDDSMRAEIVGIMFSRPPRRFGIALGPLERSEATLSWSDTCPNPQQATAEFASATNSILKILEKSKSRADSAAIS